MIKDKLINAETYYGLSKNIKKGFEWLKSQDLQNLKSDKYYIDGDKIYANVQEYETKTDALYEVHRKYIDIQCVITGNERIGVCDIKNCVSEIPYDETADIEFFMCRTKDEWQNLQESEFLILFPGDAHKPSINPSNTISKNIVKKVVVKVAVD